MNIMYKTGAGDGESLWANHIRNSIDAMVHEQGGYIWVGFCFVLLDNGLFGFKLCEFWTLMLAHGFLV